MVLTKDELIASLNNEMRILLHLASKIDPAMLDYRPAPAQRSLIELLRYLTIMAPIHLRAVAAEASDREAWGNAWRTEEATVATMGLEEVRDAIGKQPALFAELLDSCSDTYLRADMEMFGSKASRGSLVVSLVLCHLAAYRMQLFLYLKACGRPELNTVNLWVGRDTF